MLDERAGKTNASEAAANGTAVDASDEGIISPDQQQSSNSSSSGHSFWSHVSNLLHFHSWNYGMRESVTFSILPNFYSASVEAGLFSQSVSYFGITYKKALAPI